MAGDVGVDHHCFRIGRDSLFREGLELQDTFPYSAEDLRDIIRLRYRQLLQVLLFEVRGGETINKQKVKGMLKC